MRVFVTGATGFIGSHLLRKLVADGDGATAALVRPESDLWRIEDVLDRVTLIHGDLDDLTAWAEAFAEFAPDTAIHLAWGGVASGDRHEPAQTDNVARTVGVLKLAHRLGVRHWIALGSQAEYGPKNGPIDEHTPPRPNTLYGVSKLCASLLCRRLCAQFGMRGVWLRLFSSYGPRDRLGWLIPQVILALLNGERPSLTAGTQEWDYLYVTDVVEAIYRAALNPRMEGVFNLGSGHPATIRRIAQKTRELVDPRVELDFGELPFRADQVMHLQADVTRLRNALGWTPEVTLEQGLRKTVEWYRDHRDRFDN